MTKTLSELNDDLIKLSEDLKKEIGLFDADYQRSKLIPNMDRMIWKLDDFHNQYAPIDKQHQDEEDIELDLEDNNADEEENKHD